MANCNRFTKKIIEAGWKYILSMPVSEKEQHKQAWRFENEIYLCSEDVNKITPVFYELPIFMNVTFCYISNVSHSS